MPAKSRPSRPSKKTTRKVAKKVAKKGAKKVAKKVANKGTKKVAKKAPKRPAKSRQQAATMSAEPRHKMIEIAAYYRAERRHFQDGDPVADWLSGEKEIDALLNRK